MDQPLGREVGNANEIRESVEVLHGEGPADVTELTLALGEVMLELGGVGGGRDRLQEAINDGSAFEKLVAVTEAQGGDSAVLRNTDLLETPSFEETIVAGANGYVSRCDALVVGSVATRLGAGREHMDDVIDAGVGVTLLAKLGDQVRLGDPLARVRYGDEARWEAQRDQLMGAWTVQDEPVATPPLVIERIS
jgi:thymidine phosphorylase